MIVTGKMNPYDMNPYDSKRKINLDELLNAATGEYPGIPNINPFNEWQTQTPVMDMIAYANDPSSQNPVLAMVDRANQQTPQPTKIAPTNVASKSPMSPLATQKVDTSLTPSKFMMGGEQTQNQTTQPETVERKPGSVGQAMEDQRQNAMLQMMSRGIEKAGAAYGGGEITQIKPDYATSDMIGALGEQAVNMAKAKQIEEKEALEIAEKQRAQKLAEQYSDPSSSASKVMRVLAERAGLKVDQNASYNDLVKLINPAVQIRQSEIAANKSKQLDPVASARLGIMTKDLKLKERRLDLQEMREDQNRVSETLKSQGTKKLLDARDFYTKARAQLGLTGEIGEQNYAAFKAMIAGALEGGGKLTDEDVLRYTRSVSLWGRTKDLASEWTKGMPSKKSRNDLEKMLTAMEQKNNEIIGQRRYKALKEHKARFPESDENYLKGVIDGEDGYIDQYLTSLKFKDAKVAQFGGKPINAFVKKDGTFIHPETGEPFESAEEFKNLTGIDISKLGK